MAGRVGEPGRGRSWSRRMGRGAGWYGVGARPGALGTAVLIGPADAGVVRRLGGVRRGDAVRVLRADGTVAEFTVEGVEMVMAGRFDARRVYGARARGRAELRLVARGQEGGTRGEHGEHGEHGVRGGYPAHGARVVVSAYLTGVR
ncbi:sortase domain-containing protein [Streptomyces bingchenggensis]|uniref:sortase domain-containing protein n=1 Tax=Streptomyces bingchenggensis TaxID=379067 RepID=UPI003CC802E5